MVEKTIPLNWMLEWHPASEEPTQEGDYLLYNECDGYHVAECLFEEDGTPNGFTFFADGGSYPVTRDFYEAWARLPNTKLLYGYFVAENRKT